MPGNPLVRFDEGRGGRTHSVALSPTLPRDLILPMAVRDFEFDPPRYFASRVTASQLNRMN